MANETIADLTAVSDLADVSTSAVFETQVPGLSAPESRKLTTLQMQQLALRMGDFDAVAAAALSATALFPVYDAALASPDARKITLAELRLLITGGVLLAAGRAKVGTTAGWVVGAADNLGKLATLPAAQTASTLVIPLTGLKIGDVITKFSLMGSVQSGGNVGTVDASLRMLTAAAAGATDSSLGAITQVSVTANTILSASNAEKVLAAAHTVAAGESFYVLVTSTTGAAVTQELQQILLTTLPF